MSLEYQIAEILFTLSQVTEMDGLAYLYEELETLRDVKQALNEHDEECLCAHCALAEHEEEEAELHAELLAYESPRPEFLEPSPQPISPLPVGRPVPLKRSNAISAYTEAGTNACEGGKVQPETPVYTPEETPAAPKPVLNPEEEDEDCYCECTDCSGAVVYADDSDHRDCFGALYTLRGAEVIYDDECNFEGNDL